MAMEISDLDENTRDEINTGTPIPYDIRIDELTAFQSFMDFAHSHTLNNPGVARAQVITQNYICFVYLGDACFKILRKKFKKPNLFSQNEKKREERWSFSLFCFQM